MPSFSAGLRIVYCVLNQNMHQSLMSQLLNLYKSGISTVGCRSVHAKTIIRVNLDQQQCNTRCTAILDVNATRNLSTLIGGSTVENCWRTADSFKTLLPKPATVKCHKTFSSGDKNKEDRFKSNKDSSRTDMAPPPRTPISPSASCATDRNEEMAGFVQRMKTQQEQNGVCDASTTNSSGNHECPILGRTRSLNAPSPIQQFGPCGRIMRNSAMVMTIQDPASQRLTWYKPPLSVLVIKKVRDAMVIPPFLQLITWLTLEKRMVVFVEASVLHDPLVTSHAMFPGIKDKLMSFRETQDDLTDKIDFIICLGGDGTLLYASSLFQQSVPPVMAFHLGSLGFLTPFKFNNYQEQVTNVLEGHAALTLRSRLRCIILRRGQEKQLSSTSSQSSATTTNKTNEKSVPTIKTSTACTGGMKVPTNLLVLNEVVIDRGPSPYLSNLDLYLDGKRITSVQGDGLIVSTPTGSTAYAVAAGASMIHPSVPAIMVTPICPHSLSFRPIVVPAGVELKIAVSKDSRNTAWVSFDGRMRQELKHEDSLRVTTSIYPVPSICAEDQIADWFASLDECLRWNDRKRQRHLDSPPPPPTTDSSSPAAADDDHQQLLMKDEDHLHRHHLDNHLEQNEEEEEEDSYCCSSSSPSSSPIPSLLIAETASPNSLQSASKPAAILESVVEKKEEDGGSNEGGTFKGTT